MRGPVIVHGQVLLELERHPDAKLVYVDPSQVVMIQPDEEGVTIIHTYALGGHVRVLGEPSDVSRMICEARGMINSLTLGALVGMVRDELKPKAEIIN